MSFYDYVEGRRIACDYGDGGFYAMLQACMRMADTDNLNQLKDAFPAVYTELQTRYNSPGGLLPGEKP